MRRKEAIGSPHCARFIRTQRKATGNVAFGTLRGDWPTTHARLAEEAGREVDRARLESEVDARFGAGAFAVMNERYERFLDEAPARNAALAERQQQERDWMARYVTDYIRRHGRYPTTIPPMPAP